MHATRFAHQEVLSHLLGFLSSCKTSWSNTTASKVNLPPKTCASRNASQEERSEFIKSLQPALLRKSWRYLKTSDTALKVHTGHLTCRLMSMLLRRVRSSCRSEAHVGQKLMPVSRSCRSAAHVGQPLVSVSFLVFNECGDPRDTIVPAVRGASEFQDLLRAL